MDAPAVGRVSGGADGVMPGERVQREGARLQGDSRLRGNDGDYGLGMTTRSVDTKRMTADDLLRLYGEGVRGELIRGVLCETMPTGQEHGEVAANLTILLGMFVKPRKLGRLTTSDSGVWLERDPDTVREPDIAYFSAQKMPPGERVRGYAEVIPDLVVEIMSPADSLRAVNDKALMWLSYGVRLVWAVRPDTQAVDVYRHGRAARTLTDADTLDGLDVLPGFRCAVRDVFDG